jgi:hypothetical protein
MVARQVIIFRDAVMLQTFQMRFILIEIDGEVADLQNISLYCSLLPTL